MGFKKSFPPNRDGGGYRLYNYRYGARDFMTPFKESELAPYHQTLIFVETQCVGLCTHTASMVNNCTHDLFPRVHFHHHEDIARKDVRIHVFRLRPPKKDREETEENVIDHELANWLEDEAD
eukprot:1194929-Prorocentrum_minimum.AAC.3